MGPDRESSALPIPELSFSERFFDVQVAWAHDRPGHGHAAASDGYQRLLSAHKGTGLGRGSSGREPGPPGISRLTVPLMVALAGFAVARLASEGVTSAAMATAKLLTMYFFTMLRLSVVGISTGLSWTTAV